MIQAADGGVMMWGIFSWHTKRQSKTAYEDYRCQHKLIRSSRWADCKLLIHTSTAEKTGLYTSTIILLINQFLSRVSLFFMSCFFLNLLLSMSPMSICFLDDFTLKALPLMWNIYRKCCVEKQKLKQQMSQCDPPVTSPNWFGLMVVAILLFGTRNDHRLDNAGAEEDILTPQSISSFIV